MDFVGCGQWRLPTPPAPGYLYAKWLLARAGGGPFPREQVLLEDGSDFKEDVPKDGRPHQQAHVAGFQGGGHGGSISRRRAQTHGFQEAAEGVHLPPALVHVLPGPCVELLPGVVEQRLAGLQTLLPPVPVEELSGFLQQHHHAALHLLSQLQLQLLFRAGQECPEGLPERARPRHRPSRLSPMSAGGKDKLQQNTTLYAYVFTVLHFHKIRLGENKLDL